MKKRQKCKTKKMFFANNGFSLIELIVVMAIMVVLVAIIAPLYTMYIGRSKRAACIQSRQTLYDSVIYECAGGNPDLTKFGTVSGDTIIPTQEICPEGGSVTVQMHMDEAITATVLCSEHAEVIGSTTE